MISNKLKKEFVKKSILQLIEYDKKYHKLYLLGVDLINFNDKLPSIIIKSLAMIISNDDDKIKSITDDIEWWIYEDVEKIIYIENKSFNVKKIDKFIDWIFNHYK